MSKDKKVLKYVGVGITVTLIDFVTYSLLMAIIFSENVNMVGPASVISGIVATFAAYLLHGNITWRTKDPGKFGIVKFFAWNAFMVILLRPLMSVIFKSFTGLYQFGYMISSAIHLPFEYDFVESTGIYLLMTVVTMVLNFLCYDRVVFGGADKKQREEVVVESVRESGEEKKSQRKTKKDAE